MGNCMWKPNINFSKRFEANILLSVPSEKVYEIVVFSYSGTYVLDGAEGPGTSVWNYGCWRSGSRQSCGNIWCRRCKLVLGGPGVPYSTSAPNLWANQNVQISRLLVPPPEVQVIDWSWHYEGLAIRQNSSLIFRTMPLQSSKLLWWKWVIYGRQPRSHLRKEIIGPHQILDLCVIIVFSIGFFIKVSIQTSND